MGVLNSVSDREVKKSFFLYRICFHILQISNYYFDTWSLRRSAPTFTSSVTSTDAAQHYKKYL